MGRRVWESAGKCGRVQVSGQESAGEWAGECGRVQVSGQESVGECG